MRASSASASRWCCRPARCCDDLRKLKKDNTGYDLKNLFVGAEGTLGVITAAVLKLFPKPKGREVALVGLAVAGGRAWPVRPGARTVAAAALTAFELIGQRPLRLRLRHMPGVRGPPLEGDWPWYVLMEISSGRSAEDARATDRGHPVGGIRGGAGRRCGDCREPGAGRRVLAACARCCRRRRRPEGASIKHDISVPIASIPAFIEQAGKAVAGVCPGARVVCFGHMGDGNLHYNVSQPVGMATTQAFLALYRPMNKAVHDVVRSFDGSISAEHGIGQLKRDELIATAPPIAIDLMRRVKAAFDPAGIMNPGKVI